MKKHQLNIDRPAAESYASPEVTVEQVTAEQGFAISGGWAPPFGDGGGMNPA